MDNDEPQSAFVLSLIAGIVITIGSVVMLLMVNSGHWWMGMPGDHYSMMGIFSFDYALVAAIVVLGAACGIIVIIAALMLNYRPHQAKTWGAIILAFSILSLFGMGGFFIGAILGIVGGVLAITWRARGGS